jgi:MFS family permease
LYSKGSMMNDSSVTRRIATTLFVTQSLASAAYIANITVNPIVGVQLSGAPELAGLPSALMLGGAALSAYPAGRFMQRVGRRPGLALGFILGLMGMALSGVAIVQQSFMLFLLALLLLGMARGITDQSRYAAADAATIEGRAKAISTVVFASTVGAVGGPALVEPLGQLVNRYELDVLVGPSVGGAVLFVIGALVLWVFLRPDPRNLALARDEALRGPAAPVAPRSLASVIRLPLAQLALVSMVLGQVIMVLVMTVTSLHMYDHNHGLSDVSLVISAHTLGMFGFSMLTGWLTDRFGRPATIGLGALLLIAGAFVAPLSLQTPWLALGLFLVGLGWNFCYIGGSSLLSDTVTPGERGQVQGASDLLVNLASASGSLSSGFILAALSYGWLCLFGALLSVIPLLMAGMRMLAPQGQGVGIRD